LKKNKNREKAQPMGSTGGLVVTKNYIATTKSYNKIWFILHERTDEFGCPSRNYYSEILVITMYMTIFILL